MPVFRNDTTVEIFRGLKAFLELRAGIVRGKAPDTPKKSAEVENEGVENEGVENEGVENEGVEKLRRRLEEKEKEAALLRGELSGKGGVRPERIVWIFGTARTGSTWLASMLGDLSGNSWWNEPLVGDLFGTFYYLRGARHVEKRAEEFIMGNRRREGWLGSVRNFVLAEAARRYPELENRGHLFIKEPNGTMGAPLIMEAMPESRMILLVRDPRDIVASLLDANRNSGWLADWKKEKQKPPDDFDPDEFVKARTRDLALVLGKGREAYDAHSGKKAIVRYEDLRTDAAKAIRNILPRIGVPYDKAELSRVVERHDWENIPEEKKGAGKFNRKATPGGWREDLTPGQAGIVEEGLESFMREHYPA